MPWVRLTDFTGGLYVAGAADQAPVGTMRRNRALQYGPTGGVAISRGGVVALYSGLPGSPYSLFRWNGIDFAGVGTQLLSNGSNVVYGVDGSPLTFVSMPPTVGKPDWLFVAGGGGTRLFKLPSVGPLIAQFWGIEAPTTPPTPGAPTQLSTVIDALDTTAGWTFGEDAKTPGTSATIKTDATASVHFRVPRNSTGTMTKTGLTLNLTQFVTGEDSPVEDWIKLSLRFEKPRRVESFRLIFANDADFNKSFSIDVQIDDRIGKRRRRGQRRGGAADVPGVTNNEREFKVTPTGQAFRIEATELLGDVLGSPADNTWAILKIPKVAFSENGESPDWATITAIKIALTTNTKGPTTGLDSGTRVYVDDLRLVGGYGLQGEYKYRVTYKNSVTGHRSNASPDYGISRNVERERILVSNIPFSPDPQVDIRELWRTLGNGSVYFHLADITDPIETTFLDTFADYPGLHGLTPDVLGDEELPIDNDPPLSSYEVAAGPHVQRMWWCADSAGDAAGRVYYSPAGRPEAVAGFLNVSTALHDPTRMLVRWDDRLFVFCRQTVHEIIGTTEPFVSRQVAGIPGTDAPQTCVATPFGIVYYASDRTLRLLTGMSAELLGYVPLAPLFDGQATEGLSAIVPTVCAVGAKDEVWVATSQAILTYDVAMRRWRDLGLPAGASALHFDRDRHAMQIARTSAPSIVLLDESADPPLFSDLGGAEAIPLVWEPAHVRVPPDREAALARYLVFDIDTGGQLLVPTVLIDNDALVLPAFQTSERAVVEYPINRVGRSYGARLTGNLTQARVKWYEMDVDLYLPEAHAAIAPTSEVPRLPEQTTAETMPEEEATSA